MHPFFILDGGDPRVSTGSGLFDLIDRLFVLLLGITWPCLPKGSEGEQTECERRCTLTLSFCASLFPVCLTNSFYKQVVEGHQDEDYVRDRLASILLYFQPTNVSF